MSDTGSPTSRQGSDSLAQVLPSQHNRLESPSSSGGASPRNNSSSSPSSSSPRAPLPPQQPYREPFAPRLSSSPVSRPGCASRAVSSSSFLPSSAPTSQRIANRMSSMTNIPTPPLHSFGSRPSSADPDARSTQPTSASERRIRSKSLATQFGLSSTAESRARAREARTENDSMVYLDGPLVYTCGQCRTHLTSHDDIISKSFHGRHGRAYLFDQCVNVSIGPAEDRILITGMHSVCDIFCKRCKGMVGWTYAKAYEASQKYKEGKFIIEKINLHLEENPYYDIRRPAGERVDRWRVRSMSWGNEENHRRCCPLDEPPSPSISSRDIIFEYRPSLTASTGSFSHAPDNRNATS